MVFFSICWCSNITTLENIMQESDILKNGFKSMKLSRWVLDDRAGVWVDNKIKTTIGINNDWSELFMNFKNRK